MGEGGLRCLCLAGDTGGLNGLAPIVRGLIDAGHQADLWLNEQIFDTYADSPALATKPGCLNADSAPGIAKTIGTDFDLLLATVNWSGMLERQLIQAAQEQAVPTVSPIENWGPFIGRFSEVAGGAHRDILKYLPDHVFVVDDLAKQIAMDEGVPGDRMTVMGSTHLEAFINGHHLLPSVDPAILAKQLKHDATKKAVVFFSQALRRERPPSSPDYLGYDEAQVLDDLCQVLVSTDMDCQLIVKLHPFEAEADLVLPKAIDGLDPVITKTIPSADLIHYADVIVGMVSNVLIEAAALNKPVISYQKDVADASGFIGTRLNLMTFCRRPDDLRDALLSDPVASRPASEYFGRIAQGATARAVSYLERLEHA